MWHVKHAMQKKEEEESGTQALQHPNIISPQWPGVQQRKGLHGPTTSQISGFLVHGLGQWRQQGTCLKRVMRTSLMPDQEIPQTVVHLADENSHPLDLGVVEYVPFHVKPAGHFSNCRLQDCGVSVAHLLARLMHSFLCFIPNQKKAC